MTVDASARSPLAARSSDLERIHARETGFLSQVSVRARDSRKLDLPVEPNTWRAVGDLEALWLGPDEWLVTGSARAAGIVQDLQAHTADAVVDVSANRTVLELIGEDRVRLLEQGCGLDLDPRSWRVGMCAQTLLAHVPVILQEREGQEREGQEREGSTRVFVRPSFAGYLLDWLVDAAS